MDPHISNKVDEISRTFTSTEIKLLIEKLREKIQPESSDSSSSSGKPTVKISARQIYLRGELDKRRDDH
jgi:hypothetical protein